MGPRQVEVLKFGGTSVANSGAIRESAQTVRLHAEQEGVGVTVVTSAIAGATEQLHDAERAALDPNRDYRGIINTFAQNHEAIIDDLSGTEASSPLHEHLGHEVDKLNKVLDSARIKWSASEITHDYIVSAGERVVAPIIAAYLREHGVQAVSVGAEDIIATDGIFGAANPDIEQTRDNIRRSVMPHLINGEAVVFGGYYGAVRRGQQVIFNTLDRGGSDRSATAFGEAMHDLIPVQNIILYKADVAGVMTADPRIVPEAQVNSHMLYDELKALSGVGGKVIHARAVAHAQAINATLHLKNTHNPHEMGTIVDGHLLSDEAPVKAVTYLDELPLIVVEGSAMDRRGITRRITTAIDEGGWGIKFLSQAASEQIIFIALSPQGEFNSLEDDLNEVFASLIATGGIKPISMGTTAVVDVVGNGVDNPYIKEMIFRGLQGSPDRPIDPKPGKESSGVNEVSILLHNHDGQNAINAVREIHRVIFQENN